MFVGRYGVFVGRPVWCVLVRRGHVVCLLGGMVYFFGEGGYGRISMVCV